MLKQSKAQSIDITNTQNQIMSSSFQAVPSLLSPKAKPEIVRRTADYHPSIWGNRFINCESEDNVMIEHIYIYYVFCLLKCVMCCCR